MSQHTPGPWFVAPYYKGDVESPHGRICQCGIAVTPQAEINARFIAVAPELYEALQQCVEAYTDGERTAMPNAVAVARAALAKADGQ